MIEPELAPASALPPPPRPRAGRRILIIAIAVLAAAVLSAGLWYRGALGGSPGGEPITFVVEPGATARSIVQGLEERGIIRSAFAMRLYLKLHGQGSALKPGVYELSEDLGVEAALGELLEGVPLETVRFTIPEGKTLSEIADIVAANTPIDRAHFLAAAKPAKHRPRFLPAKARTLEGALFPDTYEIEVDATADEVVQLMIDRFEQVLDGLPLGRAKRLGVSTYQAVIIASLIEREARIERDRPLIASVIYNRLAVPMKLQIDATVQYALFRRDGEYADIVYFEDLEIDSPYNTYRIDGLPPTPIAVPGEAALRAALKPADTDYLYYVACGNDGGHAFGRSGSEHQANIERCR